MVEELSVGGVVTSSSSLKLTVQSLWSRGAPLPAVRCKVPTIHSLTQSFRFLFIGLGLCYMSFLKYSCAFIVWEIKILNILCSYIKSEPSRS